jgi:hypothetical protein
MKHPVSRLLALSALFGGLAGLTSACGTDAVSASDVLGSDVQIPPELTRVETRLEPATIPAGSSTEVICTGKDQYDADFVPDADFTFDVFDANDQMPRGITVDGTKITAQFAGVVRVRCRYLGTPPMEDTSPVALAVQSGPPASVKTTILTTTVTAGDKVNAICSVRDAENNATSGETTLLVVPDTGTTVTGGKAIRFTTAGTFEVSCALTDGSITGNTITITVEPGPLAVLETVLSTDTISPLEEVDVTCPGRDAFGNSVVLDKLITLPVDGLEGIDSNRLKLTSRRAGTYPVTCVPKESWVKAESVPATLVVTAGPANSLALSLSPDRNVYTLGAQPTVTVRLIDAYDNTLPSSTGATIEARLGSTLKQTLTSGQKVNLNAEGTWKLTGKFVSGRTITTERTVVVDGSAPTIEVTFPARGEMVTSPSSTIALEGEVTDIAGGLTEVKVNGVPRPVNAGTLKFDLGMMLSAQHGLNTLTIEATDVQGQSTRIVQSFILAPGYMPATNAFAKGIIAHLARNFIDDGNHTGAINDLSTLFERVVRSFELTDYIPSPVISDSGYDVYLRNISYDPPKVAIAPANGMLVLDVDINDLSIDVVAEGFIDVGGTVSASAVTVDMQLGITVANGRPKVTVIASVVDIRDLDIDVHWSINWIIDFFTNDIRNAIIGAIDEPLRNEIPKALGDALASFAIDETFQVPGFFPGMAPLNVRLQGKPTAINLTEAALDLDLGTQVTAAQRVNWPTSGSPLRGGCFGTDGGSPVFNANKKLTMALSTDVLNQVMHAVWRGGALELSLGASAFADVDMSEFGVTDLSVDVSARLPPMLTDCREDKLVIQLGELQIDADLKLAGMPLGVGMIVAFETGASVGLDNTGSISISLDAIPSEKILVDITRIESELFTPDQEQAILDLLRDQILIKLLEGFAGGALASFPLPDLDLGTVVPQLAGQTIGLKNIVIGRNRGYLLLEGEP